jgi:hypothetical protein
MQRLFVFIFIFISFSAKSQVLVGPKAGPQLAWVKFSDRDLSNSYSRGLIPSYTFGGVLSVKSSNLFTFHTEVNYSRMGKAMTLKEGFPEIPVDKNRAIYHFIDIPIMLRTTWQQQPGLTYYLNIGPSINYWLGGKGRLHSGFYAEGGYEYKDYDISFYRDIAPEEVILIVEEPNRLQFGLNIGGGVLFEVSKKGRIMIDIRHFIGHTFLSEKGGDLGLPSYMEDLRTQSRNFAISAAYLYDIDPKAWRKGKSTMKK